MKTIHDKMENFKTIYNDELNRHENYFDNLTIEILGNSTVRAFCYEVCKGILKEQESIIGKLKEENAFCVVCKKPTKEYKVKNSIFYYFALCDSCFELQKKARGL